MWWHNQSIIQTQTSFLFSYQISVIVFDKVCSVYIQLKFDYQILFIYTSKKNKKRILQPWTCPSSIHTHTRVCVQFDHRSFREHVHIKKNDSRKDVLSINFVFKVRVHWLILITLLHRDQITLLKWRTSRDESIQLFTTVGGVYLKVHLTFLFDWQVNQFFSSLSWISNHHKQVQMKRNSSRNLCKYYLRL